MKQLELNLTSRIQPAKKMLLVDTTGKHLHQSHVINIGLEYAAQALNADTCKWFDDDIDVTQYNTIGFNVIFALFSLNIVPFLLKHGIEPLKNKRHSHRLILGGPGGTNLNEAFAEIVDTTFYGEADGDYTDRKGWHRTSRIISPPVIQHKKAVIEIARGCNHRCAFCEYAHVVGGKYREKEIGLVKDQLTDTVARNNKRLTMRTVNLAGYTHLDEMLDHCAKLKVYQGWGDIAILDAEKMLPWLEPLRITAPRIGVESFDEATRRRIGKPFSDEYLKYILVRLMKTCSLIHIYLIYGLPHDDYEQWYRWIEWLSRERTKFTHPIRMNFSITNFNPCSGTPMAQSPRVDFNAKKQFIIKWIQILKQCGFYKQSWNVEQGSDYGRHGRKEGTYDVIMELRQKGPDITPQLLHALPCGVGRTMTDKHINRFLNYK